MRYEWDESKRQANLVKHGADFADAVGALEDLHNRTVEDRDTSGDLISFSTPRAGQAFAKKQ